MTFDMEPWEGEWCGGEADAWMGAPETWLELLFGPVYFALQREIQHEIGPEYEMWLEILENE